MLHSVPSKSLSAFALSYALSIASCSGSARNSELMPTGNRPTSLFADAAPSSEESQPTTAIFDASPDAVDGGTLDSSSPIPQPLIGTASANELRRLATEAVLKAERATYPTDHGMTVHPQRIRNIPFGKEERIAFPIYVRYADSDRVNCRLVIVQREKGTSELVPVPISADPMECKRIRELAHVDLNGDGVLDLAYLVDMPSNRYDAIVSEVAVYLSDRARATYCYAPQASESLTILTRDPKAVAKTIEREVARLGKSVLECWSGRQ
jgi:hypothetical protein